VSEYRPRSNCVNEAAVQASFIISKTTDKRKIPFWTVCEGQSSRNTLYCETTALKKNTSLSANMAVEHVNDLAEDTQCELKEMCKIIVA
jgi:hypothetical protein